VTLSYRLVSLSRPWLSPHSHPSHLFDVVHHREAFPLSAQLALTAEREAPHPFVLDCFGASFNCDVNASPVDLVDSQIPSVSIVTVPAEVPFAGVLASGSADWLDRSSYFEFGVTGVPSRHRCAELE